jgi:hypothetical protein
VGGASTPQVTRFISDIAYNDETTGPWGLAFDPVTHDLFVSLWDARAVLQISGFPPPAAAPVARALTVTVTGAEGRVVSTPPGIDCPGDCTESYRDGALVTLGAEFSEGTTSVTWSDDCNGTEVNCTVTASADLSVTATLASQ